MIDYLKDDEVNHLLSAYHEAGHVLAVLEVERVNLGILDIVTIDEDSGTTEWYSPEDVDNKFIATVNVAGMAAGKVMMSRTEWWDGAEEDMEDTLAIVGSEGMRKALDTEVRRLRRRKNKVKLIAVTLLLLDKKSVVRDDILRALGEEQ